MGLKEVSPGYYESDLAERYPLLFDPKGTIISLNYEMGWDSILERLCGAIYPHILQWRGENPDLKSPTFCQIKNKFGYLRIYTNSNDAWDSDLYRKFGVLISRAEDESGTTCGACSSKFEEKDGMSVFCGDCPKKDSRGTWGRHMATIRVERRSDG